MTEENKEKPAPVKFRLSLQSHILVSLALLAIQVLEAIAAREAYSIENRYIPSGTMNIMHEKVELEVWTTTDHAKAVMDTANSREK